MRCGAGARLKNVAVEARRNGLSGLEFLEGIPGSLGGALRMNAGAMGSATFDAVESVRVMDFDGTVRELRRRNVRGLSRLRDAEKSRRAGRGAARTPDSMESIAQRMSAFSQKRWSSQPAAPSAGCMFKNPPTIPAGKLIDELGLKGMRVGGARISQEHGNFLVNDGNATAAEVLELIGILQARAKAERGIELRTEVEIIAKTFRRKIRCHSALTTKMVALWLRHDHHHDKRPVERSASGAEETRGDAWPQPEHGSHRGVGIQRSQHAGGRAGILARARAARATMRFTATDAEISRFKREGRK